MSITIEAIRSLITPLETTNLVIPNAAVAEVTSYMTPDFPYHGTPEWFLGKIKWRDHTIPVVSIDALLGERRFSAASTSRLVVVKTLHDKSPFKFFCLETRTTPRVLSVYPFVFEEVDEGEDAPPLPEVFKCRCVINGEHAVIPNLDKLEDIVATQWGLAPQMAAVELDE